MVLNSPEAKHQTFRWPKFKVSNLLVVTTIKNYVNILITFKGNKIMTTQSTIHNIIQEQRQFFNTGKTKDINFRIEQLKLLQQAIITHENYIYEALKADLHKPQLEAYVSEIGLCLEEIKHALKNIKSWTKPQAILTPITQFLSTAQINIEPLGVVLIISPWNYPLQLCLAPLVGAIAAGNCVILKPSEIAPNTSRILADIIQKTFDRAYIAIIEGGIETSQELLAEKFDHILFTGSTNVGKIVMEAAAKTLTPVTLELGGKSPCIVDADAPVETTARRIVWGKFLNAGQSCIAPDYLLVNKSIKSELLAAIAKCIKEFYGDNPLMSQDYARIINQKQFDRLTKLLQDGKIIIGGETNNSDYYISPTVIDEISWNAAIMQEEIFGPILPVFTYTDITEAIALINEKPKPLAIYIFSRNQQIQQQILQATASGGVCINDTLSHFVVLDLPFGGIGTSGIGSCHGKASFDTFSHRRSILNKSFLVDIKLRYAPYKDKLKILKWLIG